MHATDVQADDILVLRLGDKPIVRKVSRDRNTHISTTADGTVVEVVALDERTRKAMPVERPFAG